MLTGRQLNIPKDYNSEWFYAERFYLEGSLFQRFLFRSAIIPNIFLSRRVIIPKIFIPKGLYSEFRNNDPSG